MEYPVPSMWILVVAMSIAAALVAALVLIGVSIFFLIHKIRARAGARARVGGPPVCRDAALER